MQLVRLTSILVLTALIASMFAATTPALAPVAKAQTILIVKSLNVSREAWGNIWYGENATVSVVTAVKEGTNVSCLIKVLNPAGVVEIARIINLTLVPSKSYLGHWVYETTIGVNKTGYLIWYAKTKVPIYNLSKLGEKSKVVIYCGAKNKTLTFEHKPSKLVMRTWVPFPAFYAGTGEWNITAPDLNKNPNKVEEFNISVLEIVNNTVNVGIALINATVKETGPNTGVFKLTGMIAPTYKYSQVINSTGGTIIKNTTGVAIGENATVEGSWHAPTIGSPAKFMVYFGTTSTGNVTKIYLSKDNGVAIDWAYHVVNGFYKYAWSILSPTKTVLLATISNIKNNTYVPFTSSVVKVIGYIPYGIVVGPGHRTYMKEAPIIANITISGKVKIVNINGKFYAYLEDVVATIKGLKIDPKSLYLYAAYENSFVLGKPSYFWPSGQPQPYYVYIKVRYQSGPSTYDYDEYVQYFNTYQVPGKVGGYGTLSGGVTIVINDSGANFHMDQVDRVDHVYLMCYNMSTGTPETPIIDESPVYETGANTGEFVKTLTAATVLSDFGKCITPSNNELMVKYLDAAGYWRYALIPIKYTTATITVDTTLGNHEVAPGASGQYIYIYINDSDLKLNSTYRLALSAGQNFVLTFSAYGKTLGKLMIFLKNATTEVLAKTTTKYNLIIVPTSKGYNVTIPLSLINTNQIQNISEIVVVYEDYYTGALKPENITEVLKVVPVGITVTEKYVPLTDVGKVVLHVKIFDPSLITSSLGTNYAPVSIFACVDGSCTLLKTVDIPMVSYNGTFEDVIKLNLSEYGLVKPLYRYGVLALCYKSLAKNAVECAYVKLQVFKTGIWIKINGSTSVTATYGEKLKIVIHDPYLELNQLEPDTIKLSQLKNYLEYCNNSGCVPLSSIVNGDLELVETGANTSTFVLMLNVTKLLGDVHNAKGMASFTIKLKYFDLSTPPTASTWSYVTATASVTIEATPAKIEIYRVTSQGNVPASYNSTLGGYVVGPYDVVNITIYDKDWNLHPGKSDSITSSVVAVWLKLYNGTTILLNKNKNFTETGPNTGVFSFIVDLKQLCDKYGASNIAGSHIIVVYLDYRVGGVTKIVRKIFVRTWNPVLTITYWSKTEQKYVTPVIAPYPKEAVVNLTLPYIPINITICIYDPDYTGTELTVYVNSTATVTPLSVTLWRVSPGGPLCGTIELVQAPALAKLKPPTLPIHTKDTIMIKYTDKLPYPYTGPRTDVWKIHVALAKAVKPPLKINVSKLYVEYNGKPVTTVKAGSTVYIDYNLTFNYIPPTPPTGKVVIEVYGPEGATVFLWSHSGVIYPGFNKLMWIVPKIPGEYKIKIFVVYTYAKVTKYVTKTISIKVTS